MPRKPGPAVSDSKILGFYGRTPPISRHSGHKPPLEQYAPELNRKVLLS
jgi:hypothetical protein